MNLDADTIKILELPSGKTDAIFFDDDLKGFGIRLRSDGGHLRRSWIAQFRVAGRTRRSKIGDAEKLNAKQARVAATKVLAKVTLGNDPQSEKEEARKNDKRTLKSVAEGYLAMKKFQVEEGEYRSASYRVTKLYLTEKRYFGPLHAMTITDVSLMDIATRLDAITRNSGRVTAGRARSALSSMFAWAMKRGMMGAHPQNPVIATEKPKDATPRERVLKDQELAAIWHACEDDDFGRIVKLLTLTACRRNEIGGLRRSEINEHGTLTLPKERVKNKHKHELPLPPMALSIIDPIPEEIGRDHLFGNRSDQGFTRWTSCKEQLDKRLAGEVEPWCLHDIRRTVATGMGNLGIEPHIIEIILNHFKRDVAKVYNLSTYGTQVHAAMAAWNDHVQAIIGGNIVPFPKKAHETL